MATTTLHQRRQGISRGRWLWLGSAAIVLAIVIAILLTRTTSRSSTPTVSTTAVTSGSLIASVAGSGSVAAAQSLDLTFQTSGSVNVGMSDTFTAPMWLRIQPVGSSLTGAISSDGVAWRILGATGSMSLPPLVDVEISAGVNAGYTGGTGTFRRLVICP